MKKTEIIRAIVELVSVGILKSADGYRLIEQVIETTKFGTNKKEVESPTELEENPQTDIIHKELNNQNGN